MGQLDNKVAVITGGSSGIGKGSVREFVKEGAKVVIADIMDDQGEALAAELGESAAYIHTDVTDEVQIKAAVQLAVEKFGRLDCMFNNAGAPGAEGMIEEITEEGFDAAIALLYRSVFFGIKHAAPVMKARGGGSIISTASIAGLRTGYGDHLYSSCKAAVIHLTRSVSIELGPFGIRTNCICPGGIVTSIFLAGSDLSQEEKEGLYDPMRERFTNTQAIRRAGLPEDIAKAAIWLAGDNSSFVNGTAISVDGSVLDGFASSEQTAANILELLDEKERARLAARFQEPVEERLAQLAREKEDKR
jgi:NAD(P)-dependent dehydrogenase (short-subunit alcohol dehydrogenase family)